MVDGDGGFLGGVVGVIAVLVLHGVHAGHGVHNVHTLIDLPEHGVGVVKIRQPTRRGVGGNLRVRVTVLGKLGLLFLAADAVRQGCDEIELAVAALHVTACGEGGAERPGVVLQVGTGLQRVGVVAPDGGAARPGAGGIAALHGKAVLAAPDACVIVVSAAGQPYKIVDSHRRGIRVEDGAHLPQRGVKYRDGVPHGGGGKLALGAGDSLTRGRGFGFGPAASAEQGQCQRGQQAEFFVHIRNPPSKIQLNLLYHRTSRLNTLDV